VFIVVQWFKLQSTFFASIMQIDLSSKADLSICTTGSGIRTAQSVDDKERKARPNYTQCYRPYDLHATSLCQ
jgi:hypothetical protein